MLSLSVADEVAEARVAVLRFARTELVALKATYRGLAASGVQAAIEAVDRLIAAVEGVG